MVDVLIYVFVLLRQKDVSARKRAKVLSLDTRWLVRAFLSSYYCHYLFSLLNRQTLIIHSNVKLCIIVFVLPECVFVVILMRLKD